MHNFYSEDVKQTHAKQQQQQNWKCNVDERCTCIGKRILGAIRNVSPDKKRLSSFLIGCIVHVVT